jgi:hypothetical protein
LFTMMLPTVQGGSDSKTVKLKDGNLTADVQIAVKQVVVKVDSVSEALR